MHLLSWLTDYMQFAASILAVTAALSNVWSKSETSRTDRWVVALLVAVFSIPWWPSDIAEYCRWHKSYASAILLGVLSVVVYFGQLWLRLHYGRSHIVREDQVTSREILGGPVLTSEAIREQRLNPDLDTQRLFEKLHCEPDRMWVRERRKPIVFADAVLDVIRRSTAILAIVALGAYIFARHEISRLSRLHPFRVISSAEQPLVAGGGLPFTADVIGCEKVSWIVKGPASLGSEPGEISAIGDHSAYYSAPSKIPPPFADVYVIALYQGKPNPVKVRLLPLPGYATQVKAEGTDANHRTAEFTVYTINDLYSWKYDSYTLAGPEDGEAFARHLAADGLLNGFEEIICIGASSRQANLGEGMEEVRAAKRANILAEWVRKALPSKRSRVHALKIGRYDDDLRLSPEETKIERQIVIVGASHPGRIVDLKSALRDAFTKRRNENPILGMYLDHYPAEQWVIDPKN